MSALPAWLQPPDYLAALGMGTRAGQAAAAEENSQWNSGQDRRLRERDQTLRNEQTVERLKLSHEALSEKERSFNESLALKKQLAETSDALKQSQLSSIDAYRKGSLDARSGSLDERQQFHTGLLSDRQDRLSLDREKADQTKAYQDAQIEIRRAAEEAKAKGKPVIKVINGVGAVQINPDGTSHVVQTEKGRISILVDPLHPEKGVWRGPGDQPPAPVEAPAAPASQQGPSLLDRVGKGIMSLIGGGTGVAPTTPTPPPQQPPAQPNASLMTPNGFAPTLDPSAMSPGLDNPFNSADDVKSAVKAGKLKRGDALDILKKQFGFE